MKLLSFVLIIIFMYVCEESNQYVYFIFYQILKKEILEYLYVFIMYLFIVIMFKLCDSFVVC